MHSNALFPLTLTLSPGEREPLSTRWDNSPSGEHIPERPMGPPLPGGEGRGEGGTHFQLHAYGLADAFPTELRAEWEALLRIEDDRKRRLTRAAPSTGGRAKSNFLSALGGFGFPNRLLLELILICEVLKLLALLQEPQHRRTYEKTY